MSPVVINRTTETRIGFKGGLSMEITLKRQNEWTVVNISGRIELEKTHAFREACLSSLANEKVIFILDRLQFVGSTGMTEFFECLYAVEKIKSCGVRLVGLSSDFKRFIAYTKASELRMHETIDEAFKPHKDTATLSFSPGEIQSDSGTPQSFDSESN
jgi:anti-anti-sigma factor